MAPSFIARIRGVEQAKSLFILLINLVFGFTLIGWFIVLGFSVFTEGGVREKVPGNVLFINTFTLSGIVSAIIFYFYPEFRPLEYLFGLK
jgi:hypothetical protein